MIPMVIDIFAAWIISRRVTARRAFTMSAKLTRLAKKNRKKVPSCSS